MIQRAELLSGNTGPCRVVKTEALCRDVTILGLGAEAVVQPWAASRPEARLAGEECVIEWDFIRILVAEIVDWQGQAWEQDALIRALGRALRRRRDADLAVGGLIDRIVTDATQAHRMGECLDQVLDRARSVFRTEGWCPQAPQALEGLRQVMADRGQPCPRVTWEGNCSPAG